MKKIAVLLFVLMLAVPAVSLAKMKAPDVLDTEKIMTDESLGKYKVVGIKKFATDDVKYENVDDEEMKRMKRFLRDAQDSLAKTIKNDLEDHDIKAIILDDEEGKGKADMIVEGSITKVDLGSTFNRVFWGMGAGQAGLEVEGKLVDANTGDELAEFGHENTSGLGSGEKWELMMHEVSDLGDKIGEFIRKLRK